MPTTSIRKLCCTSRNITAAFLSLTCVYSSLTLAAESWIPPASGELRKDAAPTPSVHNSARFKETLLQVDINQQQLNQTVLVLEDNDGGLYLWSHDLQRWRFRQPDENTAIDY